MDFFEHQAHARRVTRRMVLLFLLAVVCVVLAVNLVTAGLWLSIAAQHPTSVQAVPPSFRLWVSLITLGVIAVFSLAQILELAQDGGHAVARMFGARRVRRETQEASERRLLNVVDEMAIASGITAPPVYVMDDEAGINAFAAGYSPNQAVIAVTRGALQTLNRDELQGVIAHEFSHVLNGDMRLNVRMIGLLHGILAVAFIGRVLMHYGSKNRSKQSSNFILLGLALFVIGYVGVLFGSLIKAAVSRQREFLADASAVQFTRNPDGLGSALLRIGRHAPGAKMDNPRADELSHMFFGEALESSWNGLFDTHPPLKERVKRLFGGRIPAHLPLKRHEAPEPQASAGAVETAAADRSLASAAGLAALTRGAAAQDAQTLYASIGAPVAAHIQFAQQLLQQLPPAVNAALCSTDGAYGLLYALLLSLDNAQAEQLLEILRATEADAARTDLAIALLPEVIKLGRATRLPLAELAIPLLVPLPLTEREVFLSCCRRLIEADRKLSLEEFVYYTLLEAQLGPQAGRLARRVLHHMAPAMNSASVILALLAHTGHSSADGVRAAYQAGSAVLAMASLPTLPERQALGLDGVRTALSQLRALNPRLKARLVKAMLAVVMHDQVVLAAELDLMRASCAALDVPLPPLAISS
jgi:Zn-dependent protease with chaperone function